MKNKTSLLFIMLFLSKLLLSQAIDLYTPNGTKLNVGIKTELSPAEILYWNSQIGIEFSNCIIKHIH